MLRIKLAASHFARRFIGVQGRETQIFVNFAPLEAQNQTNWPARGPRPHTCTVKMRRRKRHARDAPFVEYRAACARRIGMCGYRSGPTDELVWYWISTTATKELGSAHITRVDVQH